MIAKLKTAFTLFKVGKVVADPAKWKNRQISTTMIVAVIWAASDAARAFGYEIPITEELADGIAVGVLSVVNLLLTYTTSDKVGV